jgi:hypothetical protein
LIEFINVDDFVDFEFVGKQDRFEYLDENWFGIYVKQLRNCRQNADQVLKKSGSI